MKKLAGTLSAALAFGFLALPVMANEPEDEPTRNCLPMSHIDRIEVLDDSTLVFHMSGDKKYVNKLRYKCTGLKRNAFIHETSINQYCDLDTITVYDTGIGMRLGSCPLGEFELYEEPKASHPPVTD